MSYIDEEVETMKDILTDMTDDFVYESETIYPEDMYFILSLLEEYYQSKAENEFGSVNTCDVAWVFAREIAMIVSENDEFNWVNAYFVINGLYESAKSEFLDYGETYDWDSQKPIEHAAQFDIDCERIEADSEVDGFEEVFSEITKTLDLYITLPDEPEESGEEEVSKLKSLIIYLSSIKKRYASDFMYDMLESSVSFQLVPLVTILVKEDFVSQYELYEGLRIVRDWTENRAKREYNMLSVGTSV